MKRFLLIDGNNQFFLKYPKAMNYQQLVMDCISLHRGFDAVYWVLTDTTHVRNDVTFTQNIKTLRPEIKTSWTQPSTTC